MRPAAAARADPLQGRLLVVGAASGRLDDRRIADLPRVLDSGDVLVLNDSATLPASLPARGPHGEPMEVRIARVLDASRLEIVLFGEGDFRTRTEHRVPPPVVEPGDALVVGRDLVARVERTSPISRRLVTVRFDVGEDRLWPAIYRDGRPVQYAHVAAPLALWDVQTAYAARPWSVEMPSAGRPLTWALLGETTRRGVTLATVTHAAGISATGDAALDAALPLDERYEVPARTARLVNAARGAGARVVAVGTSVVRALESAAARHGRVEPGRDVTSLHVGPGFVPRAVDGVLTGMHEPGTSHRALLRAFVSAEVLDRAYTFASDSGYLGHELGDSMLVMPR